jgi:hypothetical protein
MQRLRTRGATLAGEMKRRATQQSPMRQTVMMVRHFTTGVLRRRSDWDLTFRHRPPYLNGAFSISSTIHSPPSSTTLAPKRASPTPWIHLPPPPTPYLLAQGRNAEDAPWVAGTSRRCLTSGRLELEVLCASGRHPGAQRTAPP